MDSQEPHPIEHTPVLRVGNLEHRLHDAVSGESFTITLSQELSLQAGVFAALLGPSGCGKTTLLTVLGLLRQPSAPESIGAFEISTNSAEEDAKTYDVKEIWKKKRFKEIEALRRKHIGFALQSGELLNSLTVEENISLPLRLNGWSAAEASKRVDELLRYFSLYDDNDHSRRLATSRINKLSGGEYQRVVLARSIAHKPRLVFVDEPTSALNRELAYSSLATLKRSLLEGETPSAVIMITHDEQLADDFADVVIRMEPEKGRAAGSVTEINYIQHSEPLSNLKEVS
ncbi:MAG: ATP-binding cassette domain-containing protein [Planctomycetaceae bacterium]